MKFKRVVALAQKETFHILRDPFTLALAIILPVAMVAVFGSAIEFNVTDIKISIVDRDRSQASRQLSEAFESSGYFKVETKHGSGEILRDLEAEKAKGVLVIEPDFEKKVESGNTGLVQVVLDGADNSTVGTILGYLGGIQEAATTKLTGEKPTGPVEMKTRFLFNPELNSSWFVVPGIAVVVIATLSILLTALTVAREWENGSMELLLSTPVEPLEIIIGKLAPYTLMGMAAVAFVYVAARLGFDVPFRGSHLLFIGSSFLFLSAYLAQGLAISVVMRRQQLAMQIALITGLLPSILLSGFIFPVESMPRFFQALTAILPARWFMVISRDIFLKGAGLVDLITPLLALTLLNVVLISISTKRFKKDLEP